MAVIKYKDANGNWQTVVGVVIQNEVVQTTGNSETAVMSQKAVTEELGRIKALEDAIAEIQNKLK